MLRREPSSRHIDGGSRLRGLQRGPKLAQDRSIRRKGFAGFDLRLKRQLDKSCPVPRNRADCIKSALDYGAKTARSSPADQ